jgi:hypothetical protein
MVNNVTSAPVFDCASSDLMNHRKSQVHRDVRGHRLLTIRPHLSRVKEDLYSNCLTSQQSSPSIKLRQMYALSRAQSTQTECRMQIPTSVA